MKRSPKGTIVYIILSCNVYRFTLRLLAMPYQSLRNARLWRLRPITLFLSPAWAKPEHGWARLIRSTSYVLNCEHVDSGVRAV